MNWAQENKGLVAVAGLMLVALIAAAVFMFGAMGKYGKARADYDSAHRRLMKLKHSKPFPSKENVAAKKKLVEEFKGEVAELNNVVAPFFSEYEEVSASDFTRDLKSVNDAFMEKALAVGMSTPEGFFMGMEDYAGRPPKRELTPSLRFEANAISFIVDALLEARVHALDIVDRVRLPGEAGATPGGKGRPGSRPKGPSASPQTTLIKHPVTVQFTGTYDSAQRFLNLIANGASHFIIVRALKIENEKKLGPERGSGPGATGVAPGPPPPDFSFEGGEDPGIEGGDLSLPESPSAVAEAVKDAQLVLGGEQVRVLAQLELVQFPKKQGDKDAKPARP